MLGWKLELMHTSEEERKKETSDNYGMQELILQQEQMELPILDLSMLFIKKEFL